MSMVVATERRMNIIPPTTLAMTMPDFVICQAAMLEVGALDIVGWWWVNDETMGERGRAAMVNNGGMRFGRQW